MARQIFSNDMVAHIWANQSQSAARNASGSIYFEGRTIFSYGLHFPMAIHIDHGIVLMNSDKCSITTGQHLQYVSRAVSHLQIVRMPDLYTIWQVIRDDANRNRKCHDAIDGQTILRYLRKNWAQIPVDSTGAAWLLKAANSCAKWENMRAKLALDAVKVAEKAEKAEKAELLEWARQFVARDWSEIRNTAWQNAAEYRQNGLKTLIAKIRKARLVAPKGKLRAELWTIEQRLRAILNLAKSNSDSHGNPLRNSKIRKLLADLRELKRENTFSGYTLKETYIQFASRTLIKLGDLAELDPHMPVSLRQSVESYRADLAKQITDYKVERRAAWESGKLGNTDLSDTDRWQSLWLRAVNPVIDGCKVISGELQTSHGANVPLRHAFHVFQFIAHCRAKGQGWIAGQSKPSQIRVGHFHVDRIDRSGNFKAGCHNIEWPDVERLARQLGLIDCIMPMDELQREFGE